MSILTQPKFNGVVIIRKTTNSEQAFLMIKWKFSKIHGAMKSNGRCPRMNNCSSGADLQFLIRNTVNLGDHHAFEIMNEQVWCPDMLQKLLIHMQLNWNWTVAIFSTWC